MLEKGRRHPAITQLHDLMGLLGLLGHVPWLMHLLRKLKGDKSGPIRFIDWCNKEVLAKQKVPGILLLAVHMCAFRARHSQNSGIRDRERVLEERPAQRHRHLAYQSER